MKTNTKMSTMINAYVTIIEISTIYRCFLTGDSQAKVLLAVQKVVLDGDLILNF